MINIRKGEPNDIPQVFGLIKELAVYENALHEVTNTETQLEIDGFAENPTYGLIVAEDTDKIVGISLYYYRYSTWKGKRLYLEDIIVTESRRREGIGTKLFDETLSAARQSRCTGLMWQVLDWNQPAIDFYKKYNNTRFDHEWVNCHIEL